MRPRVRFVVLVGFLCVAAFSLAAVRAAEQGTGQGQNQWRYTFHNGQWWYWLPAGRWVYWRDNRWNDYDPKTFTSSNSSGVVAAGRAGSSSESRATTQSDVRPFYGHALSNLDRRRLQENNEVGPFYGHALPSEVFGPCRARRSVAPFYGHAVSSGD